MKRDPLWLMVAEAETHATSCNHECPHYREVEQSEPCGDGFTSFSWWECTLGEKIYHLATDCPAVQRALEDRLLDLESELVEGNCRLIETGVAD